MKVSIDLHVHSGLSPCADDDMTPNNIVNMAYIKGLDVISVTDHNSMENVEVVMELGKKRNILVIPGIEVTTKEEIHVLCYFENLSNGLGFQRKIYEGLPKIPNDKGLFGKQLIYDMEDNIIDEVHSLLISSTKYSISEINRLVKTYNGVMVPSHVDKKAYSLLSVLGFIPMNLDVKTIEVSKKCDFSVLAKLIDLDNFNILQNSDAHYLKDINESTFFLHPKDKSIGAVLDCLRSNRRLQK